MTGWSSKNNFYLDMDGVLADFEKRATMLCEMVPHKFEEKYGEVAFWERLHSDPEFFLNLDPMPDMRELYDAVKHLEPTILTGIPRGMDPVNNQKHEWCKRQFGSDQKIICCQASKKSLHIYEKGDILVDDRQRYMKKWLDRGGIFVHHKTAKESIQRLKYLGVI